MKHAEALRIAVNEARATSRKTYVYGVQRVRYVRVGGQWRRGDTYWEYRWSYNETWFRFRQDYRIVSGGLS